MYVDDETGFVLFCDAPLFCVKTAEFEVLPYERILCHMTWYLTSKLNGTGTRRFVMLEIKKLVIALMPWR